LIPAFREGVIISDRNFPLQDEPIGDAAIEGKLKKLAARARELQTAEKPSTLP
jgi:hypothetical protein